MLALPTKKKDLFTHILSDMQVLSSTFCAGPADEQYGVKHILFVLSNVQGLSIVSGKAPPIKRRA